MGKNSNTDGEREKRGLRDGSVSAMDVLFSGHREFFDIIFNYSIENSDFQR